MLVIGIDPGLSGALAFVDCQPNRRPEAIDAIDVPTVNEGAKRRPSVSSLANWLSNKRPDVCYIERGQAMPTKGRHGSKGEEWRGQGASSAFIYGRAVGYLECIVLCHGIRLRTAEPSVWKRRFDLLKKDKGASLALAREKVDGAEPFVKRQKDNHRAEAILIAVYGAIEMGIPGIIGFDAVSGGRGAGIDLKLA